MAVKSEHVQSTTEHDSSPDHTPVEKPQAFDEPLFDAVSAALLKTTPPQIDAHAAAVRRLQGNIRARVMTQFQQNFGNHYVQRVLDRVRPADQPADDLAQRIQAASSDGGALDATVRQCLATGFGADLSDVRVHTDQEADRLSREVSAIAFTTGPHIFFREGAYQPATPGGLRLIAHEAAHTLQQASGPVDGTATDQGVSISDPADGFEQAAERAADRVLAGESAPGYQNTATNTSGLAAVQRDVDLGDVEEWPDAQPAVDMGDVESWPDVQPAVDLGDTESWPENQAAETEQIVDTVQSAKSIADKALTGTDILLADNPYYEGAKMVYEGGGVALDVYGNYVSGQGGGEAIAGAAGGAAAGMGLDELTGGVGMSDAKINAVNDIAQMVYGPHQEGDTSPGVTDVTQVAADMTASQLTENIGSNVGRGIYNVATGDTEALERQGQEMEEGESGAALQGYSLATDVTSEVAGGKDLESAIIDVGSKGQDSSIARLGNYLGDEAYQFINKDLPEASEFAQKDLSRAWDWATD